MIVLLLIERVKEIKVEWAIIGRLNERLSRFLIYCSFIH